MNKDITILYVDDEPINLQLFSLNFNRMYSVIVADSANAGLEKLEIHSEVAVVVSDMKMPGMNGLEFIKIAKEKYPDITFYILTGFEITNDIADALEEKLIVRYFQKPFNVKEIDMSIKEILSLN